MGNKVARKALQDIARQNGVSVEEVRREIELALEMGRNNPDPKVRAEWEAVPCRGDKPTVEEVIIHMALKAKRGGLN